MIVGEVGGPAYRDIGRNGRKEIIFDNHDYYAFAPPSKLQVFKFSSQG